MLDLLEFITATENDLKRRVKKIKIEKFPTNFDNDI